MVIAIIIILLFLILVSSQGGRDVLRAFVGYTIALGAFALVVLGLILLYVELTGG